MLVRHLVLAGCSALALACSSTTGGQDGTRSDDVTNVSQTPAKDQSIGNCWLYATLGWVESLHLAHSGEELNLSESYLTYLAAFTRITTDEFVFDPRGEWNTGDFFGQGAELVTRYGLMDESAFIASEAISGVEAPPTEMKPFASSPAPSCSTCASCAVSVEIRPA